MKILVMGGSGFIGGHLIPALQSRGHAVRCLDLVPCRHALGIVGNILDDAALDRALAGQDCVINLAAEHRDDVRPVERYYQTNVTGARCVTAALARHGIARLIFTSTVAIYGLEQPMADENTPPRPFNHYGISKAQAESVYCEWARSAPGHSLCVLRPTVVFGEGNRGNVFQLIEQIRRRRFVMVGKGLNRKSMLYVGNLVAFICRQLDTPPGVSVYNVADHPAPSMRELVDTIHALLAPPARRAGPSLPYAPALAAAMLLDGIARLSGRTFPISSARIRKFCADTRVNTGAMQASGFVPPHDLRDGLARMIASLSDPNQPAVP